MHKLLHELPLAPPGLEEEARRQFPYRHISPEEFAARESHKIAGFSLGNYRYLDGELNEWIHALDDIFFTSGERERVREKILTAEELKQLQSESEEPF